MVHSAGLVLAFGVIGVGASADPLDYLASVAVDWNYLRSALCVHSNAILPSRQAVGIQEVGAIIHAVPHRTGQATNQSAPGYIIFSKVSAITVGVSAMPIPASRKAAILAAAVPLPPLTIAPA